MRVLFEAGLAQRIGLDRFCAGIDNLIAIHDGDIANGIGECERLLPRPQRHHRGSITVI
jgi:hypothetical protein